MIYQIIAGPDGHDTDLAPVPVEAMPRLGLKTLRIAFAPSFPGFPVAGGISAAVENLAGQLKGAGAIVEEAKLPKLDLHDDLAQGGALIGMMMGAAQPEPPKQPTSVSRWFEALTRRDKSILAWDAFFDRYDALLCPVAMTTAFPHCEPGTPINVDGEEQSYWMLPAYGAVFNYSGHPALSMPCGQDSDGLPIGLELVGKRWPELRLLGIARAMAAFTAGFPVRRVIERSATIHRAPAAGRARHQEFRAGKQPTAGASDAGTQDCDVDAVHALGAADDRKAIDRILGGSQWCGNRVRAPRRRVTLPSPPRTGRAPWRQDHRRDRRRRNPSRR